MDPTLVKIGGLNYNVLRLVDQILLGETFRDQKESCWNLLDSNKIDRKLITNARLFC